MGMVDIDAETGTEIEGEIFGTSVRATVVAGVRSTPINGVLEYDFKL